MHPVEGRRGACVGARSMDIGYIYDVRDGAREMIETRENGHIRWDTRDEEYR